MTQDRQLTTQRRGLLNRWFTAHPAEVGESYMRHWMAAMGFAGYLLVTALAALVHAMIPGLCVKTASQRIARLNDRLQQRSVDS